MSDVPDTMQDVVERIRHCRGAPVAQANESFDAAMQRVIRERNERIAALGAEQRSQDTRLRQLNSVLSLMASIEFPLAGFHRERLDKVATAIEQLPAA